MSKDKNSDVNWMYEGNKSLINTEDYLTGRKVDKNFEKYGPNSDFKVDSSKIDSVIGQKTIDKHSSRDQKPQSRDDKHLSRDQGPFTPRKSEKSSMLDLETIKKEDPLIAIKVKEEQIRREIFENPLKMKRLQSIVMAAMRKKFNKLAKKGQEGQFFERYLKENRQNSAKNGRNLTKHRKRHDSTSSSSSNSSNSSSSSSGEHVKSKKSRYDDSPDGRKSRDYGLTYVNYSKSSEKYVKSARKSSKSPEKSSKTREKSPKIDKFRQNSGKPAQKRKLTEAEMEEKRREMQKNAEWRQNRLISNQKRYEIESKEEEKRENSAKNRGPQFIQPILSNAVDEATIEGRIKSKRQTIQRRHNAMDMNFARK